MREGGRGENNFPRIRTEKTWEKKEQNFRDLLEDIRCSNVSVIAIPGG